MIRPLRSAVLAALVCAFLLPADAATAGGEVLSWGTFLHYVAPGQFTTNPMVAPAGLSNVVAISSGLQHAIALRSDGQVATFGEWAWGLTNVPPALTSAMVVAAGEYHTLALTRARTVLAWGASYNNQCLVPTDATNIVAVAAGGFHSVALRADGQILCWGDNRYGQCQPPAGLTNAVAIAAGTWHNLALLEDGRVVGWGSGSGGQLNPPPGLTNIVALAARASYSLALRADGVVIGWGLNDGGQTTIPANLSFPVAVAAGERHALALRRDGSVIAWGANSGGQSTVPAGLANTAAISAGSLHSTAVTGGVPPTATPPQPDITVRVGRRILLTAGVPGSQPMTYQWRRDGLTLTGATNAWLVFRSALTSDAGTYSVVASNAAGRVTNIVTRLNVWVPEFASARFLLRDDSTLGNWKGVYGSDAHLIVGHATNNPAGLLGFKRGQPYVFQTNSTDPRALEHVESPWPTNRFLACAFDPDFLELRCALPLHQTNQLSIFLMEPGGGRAEMVEILDDPTGDLLDRRSVSSLLNGSYLTWEISGPVRVRVARIAGANALVSGIFLGRTTGQPPLMRTAPANLIVPQNGRAVLAAGADGEAPLSFQWWRNGLPLADGAAFAGTKSPVLALNAATVAEVGDYTVTVSNALGVVTSSSGRVVLVGMGTPPAIATPPSGASVAVGSSVNFTVAATGTAPLAYQWRFNGTGLAGRTDSTLALASVQHADAGAYSVVVANGFGSVTSAVATLTVTNPGMPPTITREPDNSTNLIGSSAVFVVEAIGSEPLSYAWRFNGVEVPDATNATFTIARVSLTSAGGYSAVVANALGSVTSRVATLTVRRLPPKAVTGEEETTHPPKPMPDFMVVAGSGLVTFPAAELLANDSDADGDTLSVLSVGPVSRRGGAVWLSGGQVHYSPPPGSELWDAFDYVAEDATGATGASTVTLQFGSASNGSRLSAAWDAQANGIRLRGTGVPGKTYIIQGAVSAQGPWVSLSTNMPGSNGSFEWFAPGAAAPVGRFFRTAQP